MNDAILKYGKTLDAAQKEALVTVLTNTPDHVEKRFSDHLDAVTTKRATKLLECLLKRYESSFWVYGYPNMFVENMQITLIDYFPQIKGMVFSCYAPKVKGDFFSGESHIVAYDFNNTKSGSYVCGRHSPYAWDAERECERLDEECIAIWSRISLMNWRDSKRYAIKMDGFDAKLLAKIKVGDILGAITVSNSRTPLNCGSPDGFMQVVKIKSPNIYFKDIESYIGDDGNTQPIINKFIDESAPETRRWLKVGTFRHHVNVEQKFVRIKLEGERRYAYLMRPNKAGEYHVFYAHAY